MIDSLYAEYVLERQGLSVMTYDSGFIAYKCEKEECFIAEMFIKKDKRKTGLGKSMIAVISEVAKQSGCKVITANIHLNDPNASSTLVAAICTGFKVECADRGAILISKKIEGV